jgi:hypothetical protein
MLIIFYLILAGLALFPGFRSFFKRNWKVLFPMIIGASFGYLIGCFAVSGFSLTQSKAVQIFAMILGGGVGAKEGKRLLDKLS